MKIVADWYPEFQTDWQPLVVPLLLTSKGTSSIQDLIFEKRLDYWLEYRKLGINYTYSKKEQKVYFNCPQKIKSCPVKALDIRAGASLVLAGLIAPKKVLVQNAAQIERGYENIVGDLKRLGANIKYVYEQKK